MSAIEKNGREYCTTAYAAKKIGVSITTIQKLVDDELFLSWKTPGGHRRIDILSLEKYQKGQGGGGLLGRHETSIIKICAINLNEIDIDVIKKINSRLVIPVEFYAADSVFDLILKNSSNQPEYILINLEGEYLEKLKFIKSASNLWGATNFIVFNFDEVMDANGRFIFNKPNIVALNRFSEEWYSGFVSCLILSRVRSNDCVSN